MGNENLNKGLSLINIVVVVAPIVAAFLGATLGGFLKEWWVEKFYAPKLQFKKTEVHPGQIYSVIVENIGRRGADNCHALISFDSLQIEDIEHAYHSFYVDMGRPSESPIITRYAFPQLRQINEQSLCWSGGEPASCTINRDTPASIDVFRLEHTDEDTPIIEVPSEYRWAPFRVALRINEDRGIIKVTSYNAKPVSAKFHIKPDEDGHCAKLYLELDP